MTIEGGHLIWTEVEKKLNEIDNEIFEGVDKSTLSDYEKRKKIFEYLCNNLEYDFDMLTDMILNSVKNVYKIDLDSIARRDIMTQYDLVTNMLKENGKEYDSETVFQIMRRLKAGQYKHSYGPADSLKKIFDQGVGLCNSDSYVYKALLDMNGIYSTVVFCDNQMERSHAVCFVYDKEDDTYSIDDISSYTASHTYNKEVTTDIFFDYDLEYAATTFNQDYKFKNSFRASKFGERDFNVYNTADVYDLFGRPRSMLDKSEKIETSGIVTIPNDIVSLKNKSKSI